VLTLVGLGLGAGLLILILHPSGEPVSDAVQKSLPIVAVRG